MLRRAVQKSEGEEFAKENGLLFMETSAKTADGVDPAFLRTAGLVYDKMTSGKYLGQGDVCKMVYIHYECNGFVLNIYIYCFFV